MKTMNLLYLMRAVHQLPNPQNASVFLHPAADALSEDPPAGYLAETLKFSESKEAVSDALFSILQKPRWRELAEFPLGQAPLQKALSDSLPDRFLSSLPPKARQEPDKGIDQLVSESPYSVLAAEAVHRRSFGSNLQPRHIPTLILSSFFYTNTIGPVICESASSRPAIFQADHITPMILVGCWNPFLPLALNYLADKKPDLFERDHIREIAVAKEARWNAVYSIVYQILGEKRPELFMPEKKRKSSPPPAETLAQV